jgi:hypothetical protein
MTASSISISSARELMAASCVRQLSSRLCRLTTAAAFHESTTAQYQIIMGAQVGNQALAFLQIGREPLKVVVADILPEPKQRLVKRREPAFERRDRHPRRRVRMYARDLVLRCMNGGVDHVARDIDAKSLAQVLSA